MNNKESYLIKNGRWVKATKWMLFKHRIKMQFKRWKIVDSFNNRIISNIEMERYFMLSPQEKIEADKIYKEKGTISYEFYPCGGIGWGVIVKVIKTGEKINITTYDNW